MSTINQIYGDLFVASGTFVDLEDARKHRENIAMMRVREAIKIKPADQRWYEKLERVKRMAKHG